MTETNETPRDANLPSKNERTWGMLCHVSVFLGMVIPLGHILAPLIIWLIKKEELPFVADQGREVLNFQISMTIYMLLSLFLIILLIGIPMLIGLMIFSLIATIMGAIKANDGKYYRYPMTIRFINK